MKNEKNPYLKQINGRPEVTAAGLKYLDELVTSVQGPVYAFYGKASPLMAAAAMARPAIQRRRMIQANCGCKGCRKRERLIAGMPIFRV